MAAADDMRRIVPRASWRPEAVLCRLWARMRAAWWHGWGLMAQLRRRGGGGSRQPLGRPLRTFTIGFAYLNYCDRLRSLSIACDRFALCKDNCTQRVRGRWARA